jgi:hypothetical protein
MEVAGGYSKIHGTGSITWDVIFVVLSILTYLP